MLLGIAALNQGHREVSVEATRMGTETRSSGPKFVSTLGVPTKRKRALDALASEPRKQPNDGQCLQLGVNGDKDFSVL